MTSEARLAALYGELRTLGIRCLVMGGHAVRFYGVDRSTIDYDLHVAVSRPEWDDLPATLGRSPVLAGRIREGPSWRPDSFRRFVVGQLADGREERLELWRRNHLLAPFEQLEVRRVEGAYGGRTVAFLGLDDLMRSKETEREDDWRDVALLEEVADERRLAAARLGGEQAAIELLAHLRSRTGFERAAASGWTARVDLVELAAARVASPIAAAYLAPHRAEPLHSDAWPSAIAALLSGPLRQCPPGSNRHLALVEAIRRLYRRAAMEADRADKERAARG